MCVVNWFGFFKDQILPWRVNGATAASCGSNRQGRDILKGWTRIRGSQNPALGLSHFLFLINRETDTEDINIRQDEEEVGKINWLYTAAL